MAAAAVDLAEGYRRRGRLASSYALILVVIPGCLSIVAAINGDWWMLALFALPALFGLATLLLDPGRRPKNLARSLQASRRMLPTDWDLGSNHQSTGDGRLAEAGWYVDPDNGVVERLWDGEEWTSWVRPRPIEGVRMEADLAGWHPHPSRPGREVLWSGSEWTDRERDSVQDRDSPSSSRPGRGGPIFSR